MKEGRLESLKQTLGGGTPWSGNKSLRSGHRSAGAGVSEEPGDGAGSVRVGKTPAAAVTRQNCPCWGEEALLR